MAPDRCNESRYGLANASIDEANKLVHTKARSTIGNAGGYCYIINLQFELSQKDITAFGLPQGQEFVSLQTLSPAPKTGLATRK